MFDEIFVVRATPHRIARLAGPATILATYDGWSRLDRDPRAIGAATRAFACVLRLGTELEVTTYAPDGATRSSFDAETLPRGAALLRQAITHVDPRYTRRARLADACRALGVPVELLLAPPAPVALGLPSTPPVSPDRPELSPPVSPDRPELSPPVSPGRPELSPAVSPGRPELPPAVEAPAPRTGVVVAGASALGDAVLTGQSAWTIPISPRWVLHFWDGSGRERPPTHAALALAGRQPAIACWWSADEAGFVVMHGSKPVTGHQWGGTAPTTPETTATAGRLLATEFGVPDQALALIGLLRRTDLAPAGALASLFELLGLPDAGLGRATTAELAAWAATVPTAVHTSTMSGLAAVREAVRAQPNALDELSARRPLWYRLLNGGIAVVMGLATAVLAVVWQGGGISGWWVLAGAAVTLSYAWGLRPRRS
ncbi:hypothetical protein [Paractinoplanes globisporus]|uniref:Uncharacterized protein n=1 Tax=Paractinoplanes globisporus TaxID=113565 RepID=A0ABW6WWK2_9ACTN|nr:hypothetical protein [Actinoplanes globisporus]